MAINYRTETNDSLGVNSFDLQQSTANVSNGNSTQTFISFLQSSSRFIEQISSDFSSLRDGIKDGGLAYVENAEGTQWLPYTLGGTYYPKGWYVWDGTEWISSKSNVAETLEALGSGGGGSGFSGDYNDLSNLPTIPTDTVLSDADIASLGYIKTFTNTQLSQADIEAFGFSTVDNNDNTQLSDSDIAAFGYVKTDNNTQLSDADIAALGYVKTDNDTQLSDADISALGYVKTDNNTQLTDSEIEAFGYLKTPAVLPLAKGGALALEQSLLASQGQSALTILSVAATNTDRVQGCSLGSGNVVEVYANGNDYNSNTVLYREFMEAGEPICFSGVGNGAIITSTQGFYGVSEQINGGNESPMPLMSLGLAFTNTFVFAFRNSEDSDGANRGEIYLTCGALPADITITRNGVVKHETSLEPFELQTFSTDANAEFQIESTSPVMGAIQARMEQGNPRFYDARLIMPTTNDGITWPRSGNVSAPYNNTVVNYFVRDGASGDFTVSPNSAVDFDGATGATDSDYEPSGATRVKAKGLISAYSGADSAGLEASPLMPTSGMSQVVAQPFFIDDSGDGGNSGVAISSPYEGEAKVYEWNSATGVADLAYTVLLRRGVDGAGVTLAAPEDQCYPSSGLIANEAGLSTDTSVVQLVGDLGAGYIVADVPITVVVQNADPSHTPTLRSQNGTTTTSLISDDDETLVLGFTPDDVKIELTKDSSGFLRKRVIDSNGLTTYELV